MEFYYRQQKQQPAKLQLLYGFVVPLKDVYNSSIGS